MKTRKLNRLIFAVLALSIFSLAIISCAKKDTPAPGNGTPLSKDAVVQQNIRKVLKKMPKTFIVDGRTVSMTKDGFNFSDPSDGVNYSTNVGVTYSEEDHIMYIQSTSLGGGFGGTVIAGSTTLDINYTLCFSESDSAEAFNFFGSLGGVSSVIGISGDFTQIPTSIDPDSSETDITDFFNGFAAYVVYDGQASGDYEIINLLENSPIDSSSAKSDDFEWENKGFAFAVDFINNKLYISADGNLNVSGGTIAFNGRYLCISNFAQIMQDDQDDELEFSIVDGFGSMSCQ